MCEERDFENLSFNQSVLKFATKYSTVRIFFRNRKLYTFLDSSSTIINISLSGNQWNPEKSSINFKIRSIFNSFMVYAYIRTTGHFRPLESWLDSRGGYGGVSTLAEVERRGFGNTLMRLKQKNLGAPRRDPRRAMEHRGVGGAISCHHVSNVRLWYSGKGKKALHLPSCLDRGNYPFSLWSADQITLILGVPLILGAHPRVCAPFSVPR